MPLPDELQPVLHVVEVVARAIREALGEEIDAYPGARAPRQADAMNRAFRSIVIALLLDSAPGAADVTALLLAILREATERRLSAEGWNLDEARFPVSQEPGDRDDWLTFLLLSARPDRAPLYPERRRRRLTLTPGR